MNDQHGAASHVQLRGDYEEYLWDLFGRASEKGGFDFVLTLLRFTGMSIGMWDPLLEAQEALGDFSELIKRAGEDPNQAKRQYRLSLLVYCHAIEMSAPYQILYNTLRCVQGQKYEMSPFSHLARPRGRQRGVLRDVIPPSPKAKVKAIRELCQSIGETKLVEIFDSFFEDDVRHAFYHSDYCLDLDNRHFNIPGRTFGGRFSLDRIDEILSRCFAFYQAFFRTYYGFRFAMRNTRRFHRWPRYEVLELLSNEQEGLYGFTVHISNGTQCTFERHKDRVIAENVTLHNEGFGLWVGSLDELRKEWVVRGEPYRQPMDRDRYNENGEWRPIVYPAPTEGIQAEIVGLAEDPSVQGCFFYVKCTGQRVIEFYAKGSVDTGCQELVMANGMRLYRCDWLTHGEGADKSYVYDGTMPLADGSLESIKLGLAQIEETLQQLSAEKGSEITWDVKYSMVLRGGRASQGEDGVIHVVIDSSDPRSTLVVSNEGILPTRDWKIKPQWVG